MTDTVVVEPKNNKVRSSFTMDRVLMDALKERAKTGDVSVSFLIEKAIANFLGQ